MVIKYLLCVCSLCISSFIFGQNIQLPLPVKSGGMPLMEALQKRKSVRNFDESKSLSEAQISNLLWAAYGFNRENKRTVPSSQNSQEYTLYVFTNKGVYKWNDTSNVLELFKQGDFRGVTGKQGFVKDASLNIVFVADYNKIKGSEDAKPATAMVNCGFIMQNINLFCASESLACVVRGWMDAKEIGTFLQLPIYQKVVITQSVGYEKIQ